jgi:ABC-2 type transport system ATP-binding protein
MIEVNHLTKYFGPNKAVDDISFKVGKGEILGFLGPNGAGKSTTMRMITGFIPPSSGSVTIGGDDIGANSIAARKKFGYLPENAPVYRDMTVSAYLDFCARIRGFHGSEKKRKIDQTIEKCFLSKVKFQTVSTLSKGFKQRVCFAQSILHDPEYLILDEPTDGLDPNQKHEVRLMIRQMSAEKAIIFSTHILDEVDAVCTRAIIIADGRIVADDTPDNLRKRSPLAGAVSLRLTVEDPDDILKALRHLEGVNSANIIDRQNESLSLRILPENPDALITDAVMTAVMAHHGKVQSIFVEQGRLDEVFRKITTAS